MGTAGIHNEYDDYQRCDIYLSRLAVEFSSLAPSKPRFKSGTEIIKILKIYQDKSTS